MTPEFRRFWLGRSVSFVGSEVTAVALPLAAVLLLDADAREMGWLVAAQNLPWIFFGLAAGVWVDRVRRQPVLVVTNFGQAALLAVIPIAALLGQLSMLLLAAVAFGASAMSLLGSVADRAYLPSLLRRDQFVGANSRIQFSYSLSKTVGPGAAGVLVQWLTAPIAIVVDVVTFIVAGILIGSIRHPEASPPRRDTHVVADMLEGLKRLARDAVLRPLVLCGAAHNIFSTMIVAVYILYLTRTLGFTPTLLGAVLVAGGVGSVLGSVVAGRLVERIGIGPVLIASQALTGVARLLIPLADGPLARRRAAARRLRVPAWRDARDLQHHADQPAASRHRDGLPRPCQRHDRVSALGLYADRRARGRLFGRRDRLECDAVARR